MSATLDAETKKRICKIATMYYAGKGLTIREFNNRVYSVERYIVGQWEMRDCLEFLEEKEHWQRGKDFVKMQARLRYQLKSIINKVLKQMPFLVQLRNAYA